MLVLACALLLALAPAPASAQTLVPTEIFGGGDKPKPKPSEDSCGHGVTLICAGETLAEGAAGIAGDAASAGVSAAGDAVMGGIVNWAAAGASWLVSEIGTQIDRSTRPALGSSWFTRQYATVRQLAVAVSLLFLLAAIVQAVLRQDLRLLAHAAGVALPLAMLLMFVAITLVELALALTDWMTAQTLAGFGGDADHAFGELGRLLTPAALTGSPVPGLVLFLCAIVTALLALVVWIELVLREASIYVAVMFLPLAFVAMVWRPTAHWARRLGEWLAALILCKLTIATAFAIAGGALAQRGGGGGLSVLLAGCAVLLIAALTPWVLLRMLPGSTATIGPRRGSVRTATRSAPGVATATMVTRQAIVRGFGTSAKSAAGAPATRQRPAPPVPTPTPPGPTGGPKLDAPARRERVGRR